MRRASRGTAPWHRPWETTTEFGHLKISLAHRPFPHALRKLVTLGMRVGATADILDFERAHVALWSASGPDSSPIISQ